MTLKNNLKRIRINEGLTITELAQSAHVSAKVVSQTERMLRDPTEVTKNKILKGLNAALNGSQTRYRFEDLFPEPASVPMEELLEFDPR
jgi:transcriptional regulator with XRE-family HTH domain